MARARWHPWLVQLPLVLWGMSFVFDVASYHFGPSLAEAARYDLWAGLFAAAPAIVTGAYDLRSLPATGVVRGLALTHAALNAMAVGLLVASLVLHERAKAQVAAAPRFALTLSAIALMALGISGYVGGVVAHNRRLTR